jgi:hypothetical protein
MWTQHSPQSPFEIYVGCMRLCCDLVLGVVLQPNTNQIPIIDNRIMVSARVNATYRLLLEKSDHQKGTESLDSAESVYKCRDELIRRWCEGVGVEFKD